MAGIQAVPAVLKGPAWEGKTISCWRQQYCLKHLGPGTGVALAERYLPEADPDDVKVGGEPPPGLEAIW